MRCPNDYCGDSVYEHVRSNGSGSRYCTGGCGYYEELPPGSMKPPRVERKEPVAPGRVRRPKPRRA